jgi:glycine hydroxymethyltransferase
MKEPEMVQIGNWISRLLKNAQDENLIRTMKQEVEEFCVKFPVPGLILA